MAKLQQPAKAFALARRAGSASAAGILVRHCLETSNWAGAVEFHMLAGEDAEALQVCSFVFKSLCLAAQATTAAARS